MCNHKEAIENNRIKMIMIEKSRKIIAKGLNMNTKKLEKRDYTELVKTLKKVKKV